MKAKTIKRVIEKKMEEWWSSIDDEKVKELLKKNTIVTGGCIASMLLRDRVNDFDVYLRTKEAALACAEYYVEKFKTRNNPRHKDGREINLYVEELEGRVKIMVRSSGIASTTAEEGYQYFELLDPDNADTEEYVDRAVEITKDSEKSPECHPVFLTQNAITLSDKVQIVIRFYGDPDKIHENYDFIHCTNYWTPKDGLVLRKEALESLLTKELRYQGSKYPLCSIIRTRKFIRKEWTINAGQYLKMSFQLSELDLTDVNVLEDQLIGVDIAYFMEILQLIKEKCPVKIEKSYLMTIIDRIF